MKKRILSMLMAVVLVVGLIPGMSLTASAEDSAHTITFDAQNGSTTTTIATNSDGKLAELPSDPTRKGFTFKGWYDAATDGTGITTNTVFSADTIVYAQWELITEHVVNMSGPYYCGVVNSGFIDVSALVPDDAVCQTSSSFSIANNDTAIISNTGVTQSANLAQNAEIRFKTRAEAAAGTGSFTVTFRTSNYGDIKVTVNVTLSPLPEGRYTITVAESENGTVTTNVLTATENQEIVLTVTPDDKYALDTLVYNAGTTDIPITESSGAYSFVMPAGNVKVSAAFKKVVTDPVYVGGVALEPGKLYVNSNGTVVESTDNATYNAKLTGNETDGYTLYIKELAVNGVANTNMSAGVYYGGTGSLTIQMEGGTNTVTGANPTASNSASVAIYTQGDLVIQGTGTLNVTGGAAGNYGMSAAIRNNGALTITGVTVNAQASSGTSSYGIWPETFLNIENSTVTAIAGTAVNTSTSSTGSVGIYATNGCPITITNSTVTAQSDTSQGLGYGIRTYDKLTISGNQSDVTAIGGNTGSSGSYGIRSHNYPVCVNGGTLLAQCRSNISYSRAIRYDYGNVLNVGDNMVITTTTTVGGELTGTYDSTQTATYRGIKIAPAPVTYSVTVNAVTNGKVEADKTTGLVAGDTITLTLTPDSGFEIDTVKYNDGTSDTAITAVNDAYSFAMPASDVTITATFKPIEYTINYTLDNGTAVGSNPTTYTIETDTFTLTNPTRTGYTFKGWSGTGLTGDENLTVTIAKGSTGDRTYTAQWEPISFYVVLRASADTGANTRYVLATYDQPLDMPTETFSRSGYTLKSWNSKGDGNGSVNCDDGGTIKAEDVNILFDHAYFDEDLGRYCFAYMTAQWKAVKKFGVVLRASAAADAETMLVWANYDQPLEMPSETFSRSGYTLKSWNSKGDGNGKVSCDDGGTISLDGVKTLFDHAYMEEDGFYYFAYLTAQWQANQYTVRFDANGGTGTMDDQSFTYDVSQNLNANTFTKTNMYFNGWNTAADGSGTAYAAGAAAGNLTTENGGTVTLYAQWSDKPAQTITFDTSDRSATYGDGALEARTATAAGAITYSSSDPTIATVDANGVVTVLKAGGVTITATASETDGYAAGSASYKLTVAPKPLTITVADKSAYVGSQKPDLSAAEAGKDYSIEGLVGEDTVDIALSYVTEPEMNKAGEYAITATVMDASGNYDVSVVNGKLTVKYLPIIINPTYTPTVDDSEGGSTAVSDRTPTKGDTVTITPVPDEGYAVGEVTVTDSKGDTVELIDNDDGTYSFVQPAGKVTISVTYVEDACNGTVEDNCPSIAFGDLDTSKWYHEATDYVIEKGLFKGVSADSFAPDGSMTRAMFWTVLARIDGVELDESGKIWYESAMNWAVEEGISDGTMATDSITREQIITMLWRFMGRPDDYASLNGYGDADEISDWAVQAMRWAVACGIAEGYEDDTLRAGNTATRTECAALMMRFCENIM